MKETALQSHIVKLVRARDGAAHKLSNRFLIGVADLLITFPNIHGGKYEPPGFTKIVEVKLDQRAKGFGSNDRHPVVLEVTVLQHQFLKDHALAGAECGIASFVEIDHKGKNGLALLIIPDVLTYKVGDGLMPSKYTILGKGDERDRLIYDMLGGF